jgi:hypothetical protein
MTNLFPLFHLLVDNVEILKVPDVVVEKRPSKLIRVVYDKAQILGGRQDAKISLRHVRHIG